MNKPVFKIKNLTCEYLPGRPVLHIRDLEIPRGALMFVIGRSGIGKSTFIETLGLMNNTIGNSADLSMRFFAEENDEGTELKTIWRETNTVSSEFRKKNFSFIFQNTNLMLNFGAGENMMMSLLIKGTPIEEARLTVLKVMQGLSLGKEIFDKKITELSGGQRQRLAFVRAVTADFQVLFGDEPTGNLDKNTAHELMGTLKKIVAEENKTGIIVSHDLELAVHFADVILPITVRNTGNSESVGVIDNTDILYRRNNQYMTSKNEIIENPGLYLSAFLSGQVKN